MLLPKASNLFVETLMGITRAALQSEASSLLPHSRNTKVLATLRWRSRRQSARSEENVILGHGTCGTGFQTIDANMAASANLLHYQKTTLQTPPFQVLIRKLSMPTINQLVRQGRSPKIYKSKSPALTPTLSSAVCACRSRPPPRSLTRLCVNCSCAFVKRQRSNCLHRW